MDERSWLACKHPDPMLHWLQKGWKQSLFKVVHWLRLGRHSDKERRLRLFACVCLRHAWHKLESPRDKVAIEVAERYADDLATGQEMATAGERYGIPSLAETTEPFAGNSASRAVHEAARLLASNNPDDPARRPVLAQLCELLRDIFGSLPFRTPGVNPVWQTPTVVALAEAAYENRELPAGTLEPDRLAILADALEEAGCADAEIIGHLRAPGTHVRGCFVLDCLLAKK